MIDILTGTAFDARERMNHREDEVAAEFPSSGGSRRRNLLALRAQNWRAGGSPGPTWTWIDGYYFDRRGNHIENSEWSILGEFLDIPSGHSVTWRWRRDSAISIGNAIFYDAEHAYKDYWGNQGTTGQRTVNLAPYPLYVAVRICCISSDKDYCFVRDETTGEYLYKGALVQ